MLVVGLRGKEKHDFSYSICHPALQQLTEMLKGLLSLSLSTVNFNLNAVCER